MIYDWYNGGEWGGLPVRRLGHIMADMYGAMAESYRLARQSATPPGLFKANGSQTGGDDPADYDGMPLGSDYIRQNFRLVLGYLEEVTEYEPPAPSGAGIRYWAEEDTGVDVITKATLGIDALTEDSLTKPQQVQPWAILREAFNRLRYVRAGISGEIGSGEGNSDYSHLSGDWDGYSSLADPTARINAAIDSVSLSEDQQISYQLATGCTVSGVTVAGEGPPHRTWAEILISDTLEINIYDRMGEGFQFPMTDGYVRFKKISLSTGTPTGFDAEVNGNEITIEAGTEADLVLPDGVLSIITTGDVLNVATSTYDSRPVETPTGEIITTMGHYNAFDTIWLAPDYYAVTFDTMPDVS